MSRLADCRGEEAAEPVRRQENVERSKPNTQVNDALAYARDRHERLEHLIRALEDRIASALSFDAPYADDGSPPPKESPTSDPRSELTKQIFQLGHNSDLLGDHVGHLIDRIELG